MSAATRGWRKTVAACAAIATAFVLAALLLPAGPEAARAGQAPTPTKTDYNCSDFASWAEAQAFFIANGGPALDPYGLDANRNGVACESLPGAPGNAATATAFAPTVAALLPTGTPPAGASLTAVVATGTATAVASATGTASPRPTSTPAPTPTLAPGARRFEDNSSAVSYSAGWTQVLDAGSSAGHYRRSAQPGAAATFSFSGDGGVVAWGALRGPSAGRADVALDGVFLGTVDLYAPEVERGFVTVFPVPPRSHTLRITVRGDAHPAASGVEVTVDFFDVVEPVGGRGFTIQRESGGFLDRVVASWQGGSAQDGYLLARAGDSGVALLPPSGQPLAAGATSYVDAAVPASGLVCYLLLPVAGSPPAPIASSDLLCTLGARMGIAPAAVSVRLDQSTLARIGWTPSAGLQALGATYALVVVGGDALELVPVPGGAVEVPHETGGAARCYAVVSAVDGVPVGLSDLVCAVPGLARL